MYELEGFEGIGEVWLLVARGDEVRELPYGEDVPGGWELAGLVFRATKEPVGDA